MTDNKRVSWKDMGYREKVYAILMWGERAPLDITYDQSRDKIYEKHGIGFHVKHKATESLRLLKERGWKDVDIGALVNKT